MSDATQIWALYEQTAAQPPQYQPTANDKKASQLNAAAQKLQTPAAASTVGQELQQSPVATGANIVSNAADVPAQAKTASNLASRILKGGKPAAVGAASKWLGAAGLALEPTMMAVNYASDPQAFKQNLQSKNQRDIDLVDQGKYGQMAAQTAYDAAVNPVETITRSGMKAAETGRSVWDVAKSYFGNKGSALTPNAQQKAKAAGMLADNFNAALAFLQQQLNK